MLKWVNTLDLSRRLNVSLTVYNPNCTVPLTSLFQWISPAISHRRGDGFQRSKTVSLSDIPMVLVNYMENKGSTDVSGLHDPSITL